MKIRLDDGAFMPVRAHADDAGLDLRACEDQVVPAGGSAVFFTGVHVQLPPGTAGLLVSKSGLNVNHDITSDGLIDEGYTGAICVKLYNHGPSDYQVKAGDRISQLVILSVWRDPLIEVVEDFGGESERGDRGFGSTGR